MQFVGQFAVLELSGNSSAAWMIALLCLLLFEVALVLYAAFAVKEFDRLLHFSDFYEHSFVTHMLFLYTLANAVT